MLTAAPNQDFVYVLIDETSGTVLSTLVLRDEPFPAKKAKEHFKEATDADKNWKIYMRVGGQ